MSEEHPVDVTRILSAIGRGEPEATDALLPIVYEELRGLARARMRREPADHTLQATALVHEAYLRLVQIPETGWEIRNVHPEHRSAPHIEIPREILEDRRRGEREKEQRIGIQRCPTRIRRSGPNAAAAR